MDACTRCFCISPKGEIWVEDLKGYQGLRSVVGGYLEAIQLRRMNLDAFIDEEGKLKELAPNPIATVMAVSLGYRFLPGDTGIVGPMVIVGPPDANGDETSVPEDKIEKLMSMACKVAADLGIEIGS